MEKTNRRKPKFDKEAWKSEHAERTKELTDKLEAGVKDLLDSDKYKEYLTMQSKFPNYSFRNTMLILLQTGGNASYINSAKRWKDEFGRTIIKGETSLRILAPIYKKVETQQYDPKTGQLKRNENGETVTEETKEMRFKYVPVFDVRQTEGDPLPDIKVDELTGSPEGYNKLFGAIEKVSPVPIGFEEILSGAKGYYDGGEKRIAIKEGMSEAQTLKTAVHEVAHALVHSDNAKGKLRSAEELEAESIAYVVCQHYGLDTSEYSFGYLAKWGSGDIDKLKAVMSDVQKAANEIISGIDKVLLPPEKNLTNEAANHPSLRDTLSANAERVAFSNAIVPVKDDITIVDSERNTPAATRVM